MHPFEKIIVTTVFVGVTAVITGGAAVFIGFGIFLKNIFGSNKPSIPDKIIFALCLLALLTSLIISPFSAYYIRDSIFALDLRLPAEILFFATVACSHLIFFYPLYYIAPAALSYLEMVLTWPREKAEAAFRILMNEVDRAEISVTALRSRVISDEGRTFRAEFTLRIENVPRSLPYYELSIRGAETMEVFRVPTPRFSPDRLQKNAPVRNAVMKVINQKGQWIFFNAATNNLVAGSSDAISIPVEILREPPAGDRMPKTIIVLLEAWKRKKNTYSLFHRFFHKSIPVHFE